MQSQTNIKNYNNTISGNGVPGLNIPCGIPNPGQIYDDQSTGFLYGCSDGTWKFGGVTFPTNAIVFGVTPTLARAAVPADIRNMGTTQAFILPAFTTVSIPSDADYTLNAVQSVQKTIVLNSATPLTATRNVIAPLVPGQEYNIENATSGGQSITLIGPSGTGVTIANGKSASVFSDGVNYIGSSGGGSSAGGIGVQYSTDGTTLQAANITGPVYANGASAPTVETTNQANTALGFSNGQFISGDSIACSTGTTSTGPGNFFLQNGFASRLQPLVGGPYQDACQPGDQTADGNYKWVFRATNPQGGGIDPLYVSELGTNDAIFYMGNPDKQLIFQRLQLASLSHMAIPVANVQLAQGCTLSGFTADTAVAATGQTSNPFSGMQVVSTTNGSTVTCNVTAPKANDTMYIYYLIKDASGGTFTVSVDGVLQNDPFNGTTTWHNAGDNGALILTQNGINAGVASARITGLASGAHSVVFTVSSTTNAANQVWIDAVSFAPTVSLTLNPRVYAISPNQQNVGSAGAPYVSTYQGYIQSIVTNLASDGLNVAYIDTAAALLNSPTCGNGNQAQMFAVCYADTVHPNNTGHGLMATTVAGSYPSSRLLGVTSWQVRQQMKQYIAAITNGPSGFIDVNGFDYLTPTGWGPGILFNKSQGQMSWISFLSQTGLTFHTPIGAGMSWCHTGGNGTQAPDPPAASQCDLSYLGNRSFAYFGGSPQTAGMTIQNGLMQTGTSFLVNFKGPFTINSNTGGVYSTTVATSSQNFASPCWNFVAGVWNATNSTPGFVGPCLRANPLSPTITATHGQVYLQLQTSVTDAGLQVGMDFSQATLPNLLGNATVQTIGASTTGLSGIILGGTAQVGTGATTPVCATNVVCGPVSGTITFTTGTGTLSPGSVIGIQLSFNRTNIPSCIVENSAAGIQSWSNTLVTNSVDLSVKNALTASTAYTFLYQCFGN